VRFSAFTRVWPASRELAELYGGSIAAAWPLGGVGARLELPVQVSFS
jgi:hypothetical protein